MPFRTINQGSAELAALGFEKITTQGYGQCLFNALSDQLYGNESRAEEIRATVVQYMRDNPGTFKPFIPVEAGGGYRRNERRAKVSLDTLFNKSATAGETDVNWEAYLERMDLSTTYADHLEVEAFVKAFGVTVKVFQPESTYTSAADPNPQGIEKIAHLYLFLQHYSSLRPIGDQEWTGIKFAVNKLEVTALPALEEQCITIPIRSIEHQEPITPPSQSCSSSEASEESPRGIRKQKRAPVKKSKAPTNLSKPLKKSLKNPSDCERVHSEPARTPKSARKARSQMSVKKSPRAQSEQMRASPKPPKSPCNSPEKREMAPKKAPRKAPRKGTKAQSEQMRKLEELATPPDSPPEEPKKDKAMSAQRRSLLELARTPYFPTSSYAN